VRQLPVNADIEFTFSDNLDATSVNFSSIALVNSADGGSPTGTFLVDGNRVIFRPSYSDSLEGVEFGFADSATYSLVIEAAPLSSVVKTTTGRSNQTRLSCSFNTIGIRDYVPGPPSVSITPNEAEPPTTSDFQIVLEFTDLVRSTQVLNEDGTSPTVAVNLVSEVPGGGQTVFPLDGTFEFRTDINSRTSTLTFIPVGDLPSGQNGTRFLRIDVSNQIADLVGNRLVNAGEFVVPLLDSSGETGTTTESFSDVGNLDEVESASGVWSGNGYLDSTLNPATGEHAFGGSGVFGSPDADGFVFNTGTGGAPASVYSELLGVNVDVDDGVFMLRSLDVGFTESITGMGDLPLRLYVRGSAVIEGSLDLAGADAPVNWGLYRPADEQISHPNLTPPRGNPSADMLALLSDLDEAVGGLGASGSLGGADGGRGGAGWHTQAGYYNDALPGWFSEHGGGVAADPARYVNGVGSAAVVGVHGSGGGLVGGAAALGAPVPAAAAAELANDLAGGGGMGSLAWPPKSNMIPLSAEVGSGNWPNTFNGLPILTGINQAQGATFVLRLSAIHRSRGGGGGGFWSDGERGDVHDSTAFAADSFGELLENFLLDFEEYDASNGRSQNWNGIPAFAGDFDDPADRATWPSAILLDNQAGNSIEDGLGGMYRPLVGGNPEPYYSLDPASGFLRGGSGGGGAGNSQHGSFNSDRTALGAVFADNASIESYRDSDGAGGGAGGGALQLQVAGDLTVSGEINVSGGEGGSSATRVSSDFDDLIDVGGFDAQRAGDAGGGGGAGGSVLLQVGGTMSLSPSSLLLAGGSGGLGAVGNDGGDGGAGVLRVESATAFTLVDAANIVVPIDSYDLATRPEYGLTGENFASYAPDLSGSLGDLTVPRTVGVGTAFFNGNSTGATSKWIEADVGALFLRFTDYNFTVEWSDGVNPPQTIVYNDANPVAPGTTPMWLAFQTGYGFPDSQGDVTATPGSEYGWVIPGFNTAAGGADELSQSPASTRLIRFQVTFDQDLVAALIGSNPAAYFRVTEASFDWSE